MLKKTLLLLLVLALSLPLHSLAMEQPSPRDELIDLMIASAREQFDQTRGRLQRAHYASDRYVCKNFTVFMFTQNRAAFRLAEFPEVDLVIPDNLPPEQSKPYAYGVAWLDIPASDGNPFYAAASFRYDSQLSKKENQALARAFMQQVQKGDFFQMSAKYYYGVGAHSLVFTEDYDAEKDQVTWTDSNMKGEKRDGLRYGLVQFDAKKSIDWFVDAFCQKGRGATLYRLREDIIKKP